MFSKFTIYRINRQVPLQKRLRKTRIRPSVRLNLEETFLSDDEFPSPGLSSDFLSPVVASPVAHYLEDLEMSVVPESSSDAISLKLVYSIQSPEMSSTPVRRLTYASNPPGPSNVQQAANIESNQAHRSGLRLVHTFQIKQRDIRTNRVSTPKQESITSVAELRRLFDDPQDPTAKVQRSVTVGGRDHILRNSGYDLMNMSPLKSQTA